MLTLHFGVRETELQTTFDIMKRLVPSGEVEIIVDDTPWDPDNTAERVQHCQIHTMAPMATLNLIAHHFGVFLVENTRENLDGVRIFVTDKGDPTAEYIELRYPD